MRDCKLGGGASKTHLAGVDLLESLQDINDPGLDVGLGEACRGCVESDGCETGSDHGSTGDRSSLASDGQRSTSSDERSSSGSEGGNHCEGSRQVLFVSSCDEVMVEKELEWVDDAAMATKCQFLEYLSSAECIISDAFVLAVSLMESKSDRLMGPILPSKLA